MKPSVVIGAVVFVCAAVLAANADSETDYNEINPDGSFQFGMRINDRGGHYHEARGNPKTIIRGKFGSRNPANGRVEETVYTAGRRGFRARGPTIHRKMDLSQVPRGPIGTPEDPLADPFDDPSYGFGFKTPTYSRREDQDRFGRVNGLYSYLDDVGERHLVRYAASSQDGFEVTNSYPDSPNNVRYSSPLYKDPNRRARGRIAMQRKDNGQYSFISSGPDQRRSESVGPDGITRGSYSYLDDKGIQRTVQYIAGAGIGFRIVQSITGHGTHNLPRPARPEFGVRTTESNDLPGESVLFDDSPTTFDRKPPGRGNSDDFEKDINSVFEGGLDKDRPDPIPREEDLDDDLFPKIPIGSDPNEIVPDSTRKPLLPTTPPRGSFRPTRPPSSNKDGESSDRGVRAHVQNIDLLPIYPRYPSPGDALRRDTGKYYK